MPTVVGIRLRPGGKVLTFDAAGTTPEPGDVVIVSTERGEEIGETVTGPVEVGEDEIERKLKPVLRIATTRDLEIADELAAKEGDAMRRYRALVDEHGLDMKPVAVEALFDGRKMVFYFTAEERVDFRELVKELAREFKTRIDMRQIGVRDEARMIGGLGHCGQQLCCVRFGGEFEPVSIRMAKAQDLPLNPLKISGVCGRLMCCLRYEYPSYKDFKSRAPKVGARIDTPRGEAKVISLDAPREQVTLLMGDSRVQVPLGHMECGGCQSGRPCKITQESLESIEGAALTSALGALEPPKEKSSEPSGKRRRRRSGRGGGSKEGARAGSRSGAKGESRGDAKGTDGSRSSGERGGQGKDQSQGAKAESGDESGSGKTKRSGSRRRRGRRGGRGSGGGQKQGGKQTSGGQQGQKQGGQRSSGGQQTSGGDKGSGGQQGGSRQSQKKGGQGGRQSQGDSGQGQRDGSGSAGRRPRRRRNRPPGSGTS